MAENRCVSCGEIIPEGGQVCPACMEKAVRQAAREKEKFDRTNEILMDWVYPLLLIILVVMAILYAVKCG